MEENVNEINAHSEPNHEEIHQKRFLNECSFNFWSIAFFNLLIYFLSQFGMNTSNFSICDWPVTYKNQYYRLITHNYFHKNLVHLFVNMFFFYHITKDLEKKIGSMYVILWIINSVFLVSCIYLFQIKVLKYIIISCMKFYEYNFDFASSIGFSAVIFSLYTLKCSFKNSGERNVYFFGFIPVKTKFSPFIYMLLVQVINPNSSLVAHVSGILTGFLLKICLIYLIFPGKELIMAFEDKFASIISYFPKLNYVTVCRICPQYFNQELKEIDVKFQDMCCLDTICKYLANRGARDMGNRIINTTNNNILSRQESSDNDNNINII